MDSGVIAILGSIGAILTSLVPLLRKYLSGLREVRILDTIKLEPEIDKILAEIENLQSKHELLLSEQKLHKATLSFKLAEMAALEQEILLALSKEVGDQQGLNLLVDNDEITFVINKKAESELLKAEE